MPKNILLNNQNDIVYALLDTQYKKIISIVCSLLNRDLRSKFSYITGNIVDHSMTHSSCSVSTIDEVFTWKSITATIRFDNRSVCNFTFGVSNENIKFSPIVSFAVNQTIYGLHLFSKIRYVCVLVKK